MNQPHPDEKPGLKTDPMNLDKTGSPSPAAGAEIAGETPPPKPLTPEEQMALYEKDLKENDWGHQPC